MAVMECPHCDKSIDSLTRTGEKKYSCGECNMVIKYDSIRPHLDEFEVTDKRGGGSSNDSSNNSNNSGSGSQSTANQPGAGQRPDHPSSQTERERIYQRGTDGLKQIKKERLKNWLSTAEGAGAQTEERISMMFDRNESIHNNPNVLYNLLDDELSASPSFINTMVQDVFQPEQDHEDLLQSQGYQPWHKRGGQTPNQSQQRNVGGPMNATGSTGFNPNQGQQQSGRQSQNQQQSQGQPQQSNSQGSSQSNDTLTREEAEMMMNQAVQRASQQDQRNALMSGLSDATDQALQEMATNVGGLAGTVQRVIDEALVEYARQNPEWVIENMDILQKVMGATEDAAGEGNQRKQDQPEEDKKVDNALDGIMNDDGGADNPSRNTQQQQSEPDPEPVTDSSTSEPSNSEPQPDTGTPTDDAPKDDPNPDLDDKHLNDSGFEPEFDTKNFQGDTAGSSHNEDDAAQEEVESSHDEVGSTDVQENDADPEPDTQSQDSDEGFDEIFGDMAED
ncbi:MAG: hypothetical protein J07AB43_01450 [Candidatus Nanosalina sp. J07AB43]|nr:MAG: hypothetical protein J07AB43_01450 [Candidatus Nanosalina sp. J07AB43]